MGSQRPPPARDEPPPPNGPDRIWDANRRCWIEARTICRDPLGRYARKFGDEPGAQLVFRF